MKKIKYIFWAYVIGILFFTMFRLVDTLVFCLGSAVPPDMEGMYYKALFMGWRFDTVVSCYILAIPLLMVIIGQWARIKARWYYAVAHHWTVTWFIISFIACVSDIPYFLYFFTRLNAMALNWGDSLSIVVDMIVKEPSYIGFAAVFVATAVGYWFLMRTVYRKTMKCSEQPMRYAASIPVGILLIGLCVIGMRGRLEMKSPIRVGTAYFCNNAFLNQIGLNPMFTFVKSLEEMSKEKNKPIELIDPVVAQQVMDEELCIPYIPENEIVLDSNTNVVVVIMESMACDKVGFFNPQSGLTPNLDALLEQSMVFTQAYSAGIHTYNGVYSTLYSHPALLAQHTMKHTVMPSMCGLPHSLRSQGYHTLFCVTHDKEFDNLGGFLQGNDIEKVVSQECYPASEIVGTWGVPDHILFKHAIEEINALDKNKPFLACMLTCSDHGPYVYPKGISLQPKSKELHEKMVEYADWSIGQFMEQASKCDWFKNTLFVFIADHGSSAETVYDMSLSYHHVPLAFYYPGRISPQKRDDLALQIDLGPTVLGMVAPTAVSNTLGIDLLHNHRPYAYFSADDKIGVLDGEYFYLYRTSLKNENLYHYMDNDPVDRMAGNEDRAAKMKRYAFSMMQVSQQMLLEQRTGCK